MDGNHAGVEEKITVWPFPGATQTTTTLYQHLHLPFPIADRHWVIRIGSNTRLYEESKHQAWERSWELDPRGPAVLAELPSSMREAASGAIWTPQVKGGWLLVAVGWGTLAFYQLDTDIGGWIPEGLVGRYAESTLKSLFAKTGTLADRAAAHYSAGHFPIYAPDGVAIELR